MGSVHDLQPPSPIDIDLRALILMLWRRRILIMGTAFIGLAVAIFALSFITPRYTARAVVLVEASQAYSRDLEAIFGNARYNTAIILNELEIMRSRDLARKVVAQYNLADDPELRAATSEDSVSRFLSYLNVRAIPGSYAMQVEYNSARPDKAAKIANAMVDTYIAERLNRKSGSTRKVTDWLDKRLAQLKEQMRDADAAVQEYKVEHNIMEGTRNIVSAERLSELNAELMNAKSEQAAAQATLDQIKAIENDPSKIETTPNVFHADIIEKLKLEQSGLQSKLSELSARYGAKHPQIVTTKSELAQTQAELRKEILKTAETIKSQLQLAEKRVESLEKNLEEASGERFEDGEAMIKLSELQREADSTRLIFDTFIETYKKSDEREELQEADARIISYATAPRSASWPNRPLILSLSAAMALFMGLALAVLFEKLDNSFRSAMQLEGAYKFPCFGMIPAAAKTRKHDIARYVFSKPTSIVSESVRSLRTVINLRPRSGKKVRVVTVTSSFPGEGKTTLAVWLARLAARSGEKVLLIDADLRRPNVHKIMNEKPDHSLADYLNAQKALEEVIFTDEESGADIIYGANVAGSALDLIGSERMKHMILNLRPRYDLIIIDSPACLAVSDARILASLSDQMLYSVAWNRTPREVVTSGIKQFIETGYSNLAFVLTNVDVKKHAKYGYGDTVYYYGRYKEYYAEAAE